MVRAHTRSPFKEVVMDRNKVISALRTVADNVRRDMHVPGEQPSKGLSLRTNILASLGAMAEFYTAKEFNLSWNYSFMDGRCNDLIPLIYAQLGVSDLPQIIELLS